MNQLQALRDTITLAERRGMADRITRAHVGLHHLKDMLEVAERVSPPFSDAKLGRWLGWAQACVVAQGCASLDEMKQINRGHSEVRNDNELIAQIRLNEDWRELKATRWLPVAVIAYAIAVVARADTDVRLLRYARKWT